MQSFASKPQPPKIMALLINGKDRPRARGPARLASEAAHDGQLTDEPQPQEARQSLGVLGVYMSIYIYMYVYMCRG